MKTKSNPTIKLVIALAISTTVFFACKKHQEKKETTNRESTENLAAIAPPPGFTTIDAYRTDIRRIYAEALAKSMNQFEVREFIKSKTVAGMLDETEFLHSKYFDKIIFNGLNFSEILANNSQKPVSFFQEIVPKYDPALSVLIPDDYSPENWDTENHIPQVAATPSGWNDEVTIQAPLYNTSGLTGYQSSNIQPDELTVVVTETESLTIFSKPYISTNISPFFEDELYVYIENQHAGNISNAENSIRQTESNGRNPVIRGYDRDGTNKLDKLHKIKINGKQALQQMESWLKGKAEVIYMVTYNQGTPTSPDIVSKEKVLPKIKRKDAKNGKFMDVNITHFLFNDINKMDKYFCSFAEREGNGGAANVKTSNFTLKINKVTVTIKQPINWRRKDRSCGEQEVQYETPAIFPGTEFNTGIFTFSIII